MILRLFCGLPLGPRPLQCELRALTLRHIHNRDDEPHRAADVGIKEASSFGDDSTNRAVGMEDAKLGSEFSAAGRIHREEQSALDALTIVRMQALEIRR